MVKMMISGGDISVTDVALKKNNIFSLDEGQASDNNKENSEPIKICGGDTW